MSLRQGWKCSHFIWELRVQDREGKGKMGVRPGKMWSDATPWISGTATTSWQATKRHITSAQWAGWLSKREFLKKSCKKELRLGGDSVMEKEGGIYLPRPFYTCFLWSRFPLMENWFSTFQGYIICPWISLKEVGSPPPWCGIASKSRSGGMTWGGQGSAYWEWGWSRSTASTWSQPTQLGWQGHCQRCSRVLQKVGVVYSQRRKLSREI